MLPFPFCEWASFYSFRISSRLYSTMFRYPVHKVLQSYSFLLSLLLPPMSFLLFSLQYETLHKVMTHYWTFGFNGFLNVYCWYHAMFFAFHADLRQIFWCSEQEPGRCWEDSKGLAWCEVLTFLDNSALLPFPVGILNKHTHTKKKTKTKTIPK